MPNKIYSFDFETTTDSKDCRVWAWGAVPYDNVDQFTYGNNIESFIEFISKYNCRGTFHNLKFDGEFIIHYLLTHGFKHITDQTKLKQKTFYAQISDKGIFYKIIIKFEKTRCTLTDSLKIIPFSVDKIAHDFGLPISKLSIDYNEKRELGHELTDQEKEYLRHDIVILAMAMNYVRLEGLSGITIGSCALRDYKKRQGKKFETLFPKLSSVDDKFIRRSYKGGFTYANPKYTNMKIGSGIVLDVNSLYPYEMYKETNLFPVGKPVYFEGKYKPNNTFPLYVQRIFTTFKLKENHIPTIQVKSFNSSFVPTEYLTDSGEEIVELTLTNIDLQLFIDHYDAEIVYIDGYMFNGISGLFKEYIDIWFEKKINAEQDGNLALRSVAKLMQNNLYGKFATNPRGGSKYPILNNGKVAYINGPAEDRETVYIPVGSFVTAYARNETIRAAQSVYDRFLYADTDSLHLLGTEMPKNLRIHKTALGAWKHEATFTEAKYLRAKSYVERIDGKLKVTCAGMPANLHAQVTMDNFKIGATYNGKLKPVHAEGGVILTETTFKIRD